MASWAWIPIVVGAALMQTIRNAAQRSLVADLGTLAATLVRFLYGLPFALQELPTVAAAIAMPVATLGVALLPLPREQVSRKELAGLPLVVAGVPVISAQW